jgi:hypothetical protein
MAFVIPAAIAAISSVGSAVASIGGTVAGAVGGTAAGAADVSAAGGLVTGFGAAAETGASAASGLTAIGTGISTAAGTAGGIGGFMQGQYQSAVYANNAKIASQQQQNALAAGQNAESEQRIKTGELIGLQKASQGANNIDVNSGSAVDVRNSTALQGESDALAVRYNAAQQAFGYQVTAASDVAQSRMAGAAGDLSLISGIGKAGSTFISGASSLLGQQQAGALAGLS